jgi:CRP-like cAMP-binding protein
MSLLTGQPRSATVIAEEETEVLQIKKKALKPIFETNPGLVKAIGEIVEERRKLLETHEQDAAEQHINKEKGVLISIKKFFGLT